MSDKELAGLIVFIAIAVAAVLVIFFAIRNAIYRDFVLKHSGAIAKLKAVNQKYHFYQIKKYELQHSYDNGNFYDTISCQDYLIYQLVYDSDYVMSQINHVLTNKTLLQTYLKEINGVYAFGSFGDAKPLQSKSKLEKTEKKVFKKLTLKPTTIFETNVKLIRTKINGQYVESKHQTFDTAYIRYVVEELSKKNNGYYTNQKIWDSICRVERGKVTNKMRFVIYQRDGYRCRYCGRRTDNLEIDHIIPIAKGGKSTYNNLQTLCHRCNVKKGTSIIR